MASIASLKTPLCAENYLKDPEIGKAKAATPSTIEEALPTIHLIISALEIRFTDRRGFRFLVLDLFDHNIKPLSITTSASNPIFPFQKRKWALEVGEKTILKGSEADVADKIHAIVTRSKDRTGQLQPWILGDLEMIQNKVAQDKALREKD